LADISETITAALAGNRGALARLLSIAERCDDRLSTIESGIAGLVGKAYVIGVTGPPGAGKSTLINQLLPRAQAQFDRAAVLAVDPSSPFSNGALLGDRVRMQGDNLKDSVFIRSMASRGEAGGLARAAATCVRIFDACGWPVIIIETLGIGQVELEIMNLADTVLVVLNPGWGDTFQANKAGLTEAGDVFTINKADKPGVEQTRTDLLDSLALMAARPLPDVAETISTDGTGVDALWASLIGHRDRLQDCGELDSRRAGKRQQVLHKLIADQLNQRLKDALATDAGGELLAGLADGTQDIQRVVEQLLAQISQDSP